MKISHTMNLGQLAALMGPNTAPDGAAHMCDALIGAGYDDTDRVSRTHRLELLDLLVAGDAAVHAADAAIAIPVRTVLADMRRITVLVLEQRQPSAISAAEKIE